MVFYGINDCGSRTLTKKPSISRLKYINFSQKSTIYFSIVDPDPYPDPGRKNDPQNKVNKFHFLKCWIFSLDG